jgi:hypothetical protein
MKTRYDLDAIRSRVSLTDLYSEAGYVPRRAGSSWSGLCPFHEEKTGSFSMSVRGGAWRAKCFGCGWSGDAIDFYAALRGCDFKAAVAALAGRCGLGAAVVDDGWRPTPRRASGAAEEWERPWLPPLDAPTEAELATLAALRGLQVPGLRAAAEAGALWMTDWPWRWSREERRRSPGPDAVRSWTITDSARWCAQYRRMDGGLYRIGSDEAGWRTSKSWSTKNVAWPVGAADLGDRWRVLLVEGGADRLACYHFLWGLGMLGEVAVCCLLGASNRLAPQAMPLFRDREVRILMDCDPAGMGAAATWQAQLAEAGAVATVGSLYGLTRCDGRPVGDVNDLAMADARALEEAAPLFMEWGF